MLKKIKNAVHSMRFTMIATYFAVILITLALMSIYIIGLLNENLYSAERIDMFAKANIISQTISEMWDSDITVTSEKFADPADSCLAGTNIRGVIVNTSYTVLYDTNRESDMNGKVFMRDVLKQALYGEQAQLMDRSESGRMMLYVAVPVTMNGNIVGGVYLAQAVDRIEQTIKTARTSLVVFSALIILLIGMLSLGMSYIITSPMEEFISVAKEISKGNFSKRMKVKGKNEIAQMGETLNYMCEELSLLEEKRRKFVSDASHELKTPMAGIKLICDSLVAAEDPDPDMVKEFLTDMSYEVDRLTRVVERLLVLTKLDSGGNSMRLEETDIRSLVGHVVRKLQPIADKKNITIYTDYHEALFAPALIDYDKIYEALYNIIDNAVKYSPSDSLVQVDVSEKEGWIVIKVSDNGPGIPESERDRIFERFYRLDDSRARDTGGTGLGLAIAKEAVLMHGGSITVSQGRDGGSVFTIVLPLENEGEEDI